MKKFCKAIIRYALIMALVMSFQKIKTLNCEAYKIGKFSKFIYNNSGLGHWTRQEIFIERNDTIKKETMQMFPNDTVFYRIKWAESCKYQLRFIKATDSFVDSFNRHFVKPRHLNFIIQRGTDSYYIEKNRNKTDTIWIRN